MAPGDQVWAFDVDGTLIGSIRSDRLRPLVPELLAALRGRRVRCVLWSAGGGDYARRMALNHGIAEHFLGFYGKRDRGADGRFSVDHFEVGHRPTRFVDDVPAEVPAGSPVVGVSQFMGGNAADQALAPILDDLDALTGTHGRMSGR